MIKTHQSFLCFLCCLVIYVRNFILGGKNIRNVVFFRRNKDIAVSLIAAEVFIIKTVFEWRPRTPPTGQCRHNISFWFLFFIVLIYMSYGV